MYNMSHVYITITAHSSARQHRHKSFTTQRIHNKELFTGSSHQHNNNIYNKHNCLSRILHTAKKFSAFV